MAFNVTDICHWMRRANKLRGELGGDYTSPPWDIWRPVGMKRKVYRRKIAELTEFERKIESTLTKRGEEWRRRRWDN